VLFCSTTRRVHPALRPPAAVQTGALIQVVQGVGC
jgi:hypothetical protein